MKPYVHKVNYYETDKMGITHHSNYIRFMEEARIDFLDQIGFSFDKIEAQGIASPVISVSCSYIKTTTFADELFINVTIDRLSAVKLTFAYEIKNQNGELCSKGKSEHCFLNEQGRPIIVEKEKPEFYKALSEAMKEAGAGE